MYTNQAFSSGSYVEMLSGTPLLPHNYNESVGAKNGFNFITSISDTMTMHHIDGHSNAETSDLACNSFVGAGDSHVVPRTQFDRDQNVRGQGLSLSLGTLMMPSIASVPHFQHQYPDNGFSSLMTSSTPNMKGNASLNDDEVGLKELRNAECMESVSSGGFHNSIRREGLYSPHPPICINEGQSDPFLNGSSGFSNMILNSQYVKAAQELLDEIVNVQKALKQTGLEKQPSFRDIGLDGSKDYDAKSNSQSMQVTSGLSGSITNTSSELSPAERQNLLDKKTKLLSMLDEVDKRYRQYCHHMQNAVSSFDMVAGCGAAEPYTALALHTISRHFRSLRDAISGQIQVTQRSLGEQEGIPRLRYVDQKLRQQKALQQLGVMRQTWRPQRGLPESSVSILRAWLFEHFLNPYPKDSEKIMLARQTGLTRNQVANWFINARVRLWKPMVEDMYKEEFGDSEMSSNNLLPENIPNKAPRVPKSDNKREESHVQHGQFHGMKFDHASSTTELEGGVESHNDQRFNMNNSDPYSSAPIQINQNGDNCSLMASTTPATYDLSELGNFSSGGRISLSLELRNCERNEFVVSNDNMHKRSNETLASSSDTDLLDYHFTDPEKQQHKFSNSHLLHEFVV
ncbi:hypothetical protein TanjilG_27331 [Lupinus angustifolius]|uniref:Homeobox domain-containing protein n=1 Tax=Lupinus angustifolius TaxID=3871 RepID=A0A1J7I082_LUPAN|nr:PREDICTED: BEL1-like homeodomain protein 7 [Lupinus angustifolius]XP_019443219.1 PREDICTED: BEL1-like homeodomain protein 7 [Lupinus angustifolius]OIW12034.1 hypothetical protein TanjilG_27331 [Lupinus angustifolius]